MAPPRSGFNTAFSAAGFVRVRTVNAVAARNGILETIGLIAHHTDQVERPLKNCSGQRVQCERYAFVLLPAWDGRQ